MQKTGRADSSSGTSRSAGASILPSGITYEKELEHGVLQASDRAESAGCVAGLAVQRSDSVPDHDCARLAPSSELLRLKIDDFQHSGRTPPCGRLQTRHPLADISFSRNGSHEPQIHGTMSLRTCRHLLSEVFRITSDRTKMSTLFRVSIRFRRMNPGRADRLPAMGGTES
jgi:hypothetical protein